MMTCVVLVGLGACTPPALGQPAAPVAPASPVSPAASPATATTSDTPATPAGPCDSEAPDELAAPGLAVTAGIDLLATSAYVWRGFELTPDLNVQPNAWLKLGNLTLSSWINVASTRPNGDHLTEHDFTADYSVTRGRTTLSAGYINYLFPDLDTNRISHEVYAGLSHASYFAPSLRAYHDIHVGSGTYVSLGASHTYTLPGQQVALTPSLALGYNHRQWIDASTFSDLGLGLRATLPTPLPRVSIAPFVAYSRSLARAYFPSRFFYGLGVSLQ